MRRLISTLFPINYSLMILFSVSGRTKSKLFKIGTISGSPCLRHENLYGGAEV